jgi:hypothetical protein
MKGLGLLQQRLQPIAVDVQCLEGVHWADQPCDNLLVAASVGHIDQSDVATAANLDGIEFVCVNVLDFPEHHTVHIDCVVCDGALDLGSCCCRHYATSGELGKQNTHYAAFEFLYGTNFTELTSAISAHPTNTQIASAFIRSMSNLGGGR